MTPSHFFWFQDRCECGATFSADDNFCRMCGRRRQRPTTHTPPRTVRETWRSARLRESNGSLLVLLKWNIWCTGSIIVYGSIILYHIIIFWCFTNLFQYGYNRPAHIAEYVFLKEQHIVESHCLYIVYIDRIIHISSRYFMISLHFCNLESPQTIRLKMVSKRAEHWTWNWK